MSRKSADERIAEMKFSSVYPHYVNKVEKKGRTKEELTQVIEWLTGFNLAKQQELINEQVTFTEFFEQATMNENAHLVNGMMCGHRIEDEKNLLSQKARRLDKIIDELAKGRKMEKILRKPK